MPIAAAVGACITLPAAGAARGGGRPIATPHGGPKPPRQPWGGQGRQLGKARVVLQGTTCLYCLSLPYPARGDATEEQPLCHKERGHRPLSVGLVGAPTASWLAAGEREEWAACSRQPALALR